MFFPGSLRERFREWNFHAAKMVESNSYGNSLNECTDGIWWLHDSILMTSVLLVSILHCFPKTNWGLLRFFCDEGSFEVLMRMGFIMGSRQFHEQYQTMGLSRKVSPSISQKWSALFLPLKSEMPQKCVEYSSWNVGKPSVGFKDKEQWARAPPFQGWQMDYPKSMLLWKDLDVHASGWSKMMPKIHQF